MKNSRWTMVGVIAFLMLATMVWASPPVTSPSSPLLVPIDAQNAHRVDNHHAASSTASASTRANRVLWAQSNGQLAWKAMPRSALSSRYLNDDRKETIKAAVNNGTLLTVDNQGVSGCGLKASGNNKGVWGGSPDGTGVAGWSSSGWGVHGRSDSGYGVHGTSGSSGYGVYGFNMSGTAVFGLSGYDIGVRGESDEGTGVHARSSESLPLKAEGAYGSNLIEAWDIVAYPGDLRFKVTTSGDVYIDGSYYDTGADFAEMMATSEGVTYEPGDLLVIGPDGKPLPSSAPNATDLLGVYSTDPGFVGGVGEDGDITGKIPVAITGIVPLKASAENGAILPGDLLTSSSMPGHAMKASPVTIGGVTFYLPGTILGKALEPLEKGTGVILVLVTLQ